MLDVGVAVVVVGDPQPGRDHDPPQQVDAEIPAALGDLLDRAPLPGPDRASDAAACSEPTASARTIASIDTPCAGEMLEQREPVGRVGRVGVVEPGGLELARRPRAATLRAQLAAPRAFAYSFAHG